MWADVNTKPTQGKRFRVMRGEVMGVPEEYDFSTHDSEPFPLRGIGVHIYQHIVRALVLDLKIPLGHFVSDKETPILDVLAILPCAHPSVLCQQYGGLVILVENIIVYP